MQWLQQSDCAVLLLLWPEPLLLLPSLNFRSRASCWYSTSNTYDLCNLFSNSSIKFEVLFPWRALSIISWILFLRKGTMNVDTRCFCIDSSREYTFMPATFRFHSFVYPILSTPTSGKCSRSTKFRNYSNESSNIASQLSFKSPMLFKTGVYDIGRTP